MSQQPPELNQGDGPAEERSADEEAAELSASDVSKDDVSKDDVSKDDVSTEGEGTKVGDDQQDDRQSVASSASSSTAVLEPSVTTPLAESDEASLGSIVAEAHHAEERDQEKAADPMQISGVAAAGETTPASSLDAAASTPSASAGDVEVEIDVEVDVEHEVEVEAESEVETEVVEAKAAKLLLDDDTTSTGLVDNANDALAAQANEFRERAHGRLPGMPAAGEGIGYEVGPIDRNAAAEFEEPEEKTSLTPAMVSLDEVSVDEAPVETALRAILAGHDDLEADAKLVGDDVQSVLRADTEAGSNGARSDDAGYEGRSTAKMPPLPGVSLSPLPTPVGPPPGANLRNSIPPAGTSDRLSGRVRLPTPSPSAVLPPLPLPPSGRTTLPPGTFMSPLSSAAGPGTPSPLNDGPRSASAGVTLSLGTPRPSTELLGTARGTGSGRVSARGSTQVTEPMVRSRRSSASISIMPTVLNAQVKMATLNLAGLIAVTFAGGVFVGMLVLRGQSHTEPQLAAAQAPMVAPAAAPAVQPLAGTVKSDIAAAAGARATGAAAIAEPAAPAAVAATAPAAAIEPPPTPAKKTVATRPTKPRPATKAETGAEGTAETAAAPSANSGPPAVAAGGSSKAMGGLHPAAFHPTAAAAGAAGAKTVAANSVGKPAAKAKVKTAWKDPFAD